MTDPKDPFGVPDDERTIIRPNPGKRSGVQPERVEPSFTPGPILDTTDLSGLNPLEEAASLLLNLLGQIRNTASHPNSSALHQQLSGEIQEFESRAQKKGIPPETVFTARYVLCTIIDEFVLSTPWGAESIWRNRSLLRVFHQETSGGEKFFLLLNKLIKDPARNIDLLELMYVCLALGFEGRYRVEADGSSTLEAIRENLYRTIRNQRGDYETALSPKWEGLDKTLEGKGSRFPAWAMVAIAVAVSSLAYGAFRYALVENREDLSLSRISELGTQQNLIPADRLTMQAPVRRYADERPDRISLKAFLADEIAQGLVMVDEDRPDYILVRVTGNNMFASGQDTISPAFLPIFNRIGEELIRTKGRIKVIGHTDSVPMRTTGRFEARRFPSNQSLSQARAEEVVRILSTHVDPGRLTAIGMADKDPLPGIPGEDARNRRVEIQVLERRKGG